jgi:hypothetical protein
MTIHLIAGYKGSGKDSFYKKIIDKDNIKRYTQCKELQPYFYILTKPGCIDINFCFYKIPPLRKALADAVKEEVHTKLGLKFTNLECQELAKEHLFLKDESDGESSALKPLRYYYIKYALEMREKDIDHWCKKIDSGDKIYDVISNDVISNEIMITDFRFLNEQIYFESKHDVLTYRVFRKEKDNTNLADVSEHQLDGEITDFLVVGSLDDIDFAKQKFPQYSDYEISFVVL